MEAKLKKLQDNLKININNQTLLVQAITHKSFDTINNYEKLEFLGDRVLGLVISKKLIELYPNEKVGILDKKFASLVNKNKCLEVGKKLFLEKFIIVGNGLVSKNVALQMTKYPEFGYRLMGVFSDEHNDYLREKQHGYYKDC